MPNTLRTPRLELVPLEPAAIRHLLEGDRRAAERVQVLTLPPEFPTADELNGFLPVQLDRMDASPYRRDWMARLMVDASREVVGHCGFHGPPDVIGRAEIGYTVFTAFRGRGFAKESAEALTAWAFEQGQDEVFATVAPDNAASLAVVRSLGFTHVGEQQDEVDGLELIFVLRRAPAR